MYISEGRDMSWENVKNNKHALIEEIAESVERTTGEDKTIRRRLAIAMNTLKWSEADLHYMLKRDGEVDNFPAFIKWCCKIKR